MNCSACGKILLPQIAAVLVAGVFTIQPVSLHSPLKISNSELLGVKDQKFLGVSDEFSMENVFVTVNGSSVVIFFDLVISIHNTCDRIRKLPYFKFQMACNFFFFFFYRNENRRVMLTLGNLDHTHTKLLL